MKTATVALLIASAIGGSANAQVPIGEAVGEKICIKYGPCQLDLKKNGFECTAISSSSFVRRVCHDNKHNFLTILLNDTWYPYCDVDVLDVLQLIAAPSIERHYNENFRSGPSGKRSRFDCRDKSMPDFTANR